jgi:hypothetical protein
MLTVRSDSVRGHPALVAKRAASMPHTKLAFAVFCGLMAACLAQDAPAYADATGSSAPTTAAPANTPAPAEGPAEPLNTLFQLEPLVKVRYYFQSNVGGKGKADYRLTLGRDDKRRHMQYNINIPIVTRYAATGPPMTGLGNVSLYAAHVDLGEGYSHTLAGELRLPTATNGVSSNDTQLRPMYGIRWSGPRASFTLDNTFAQSIVVPPGSTWTSYYDFKMAAAPLVSHGTFAAFYQGRFIFTKGGTYASAIGPNVVAKLWPAATLNAYDIWGIGASGQTNLWRYKLQLNLTVKL